MNQQKLEITIRRAEPDDYEKIWQVFNDSTVVWGTLQLPYPTKESWRQRLQNSERIGLLAFDENGYQDEAIGYLGLGTRDRPRTKHVGDIGMGVREAWQGQGVGSALMAAAVDMADRWLNIVRLELHVYTDNEPAIHLYKKFGFDGYSLAPDSGVAEFWQKRL